MESPIGSTAPSMDESDFYHIDAGDPETDSEGTGSEPATPPPAEVAAEPAAPSSGSLSPYFTTAGTWAWSWMIWNRMEQIVGQKIEPDHPNFHEIRLLSDYTSLELTDSVGLKIIQYFTLCFFPVQIIPAGLHRSNEVEGREPSSLLKNSSWRQNQVFIPYVMPSHIVLFIVDFSRRQIQYYDSQSVPLKDRKPYEGFSFMEDMEMLKNLAFPDDPAARFVEIFDLNMTPHQQDKHNCGIYVFDAVQRMLEGISFEKICEKGMSSEEAFQRRDAFSKSIYTFYNRDG